MDEQFHDFVLNLVLQSYSPSKIKALLQSMNLPYSSEQLEEIKDDLLSKAKEIRGRELPDNVFSIFNRCISYEHKRGGDK